MYTSYYCDYVLQVEEISMQWLSKSKFTFMSNLMNKSPSFLIFQSIFNQWNMDKVYYIYSAMCYFFFSLTGIMLDRFSENFSRIILK